MIEWLGYAAAAFTPEQYLWWTRLQCLVWTAADVVIVLALMRLCNAARQMADCPPHFVPYLVLACSLLFVPMIPVAPTGGLIFALELCITVPHFMLILYLLAANQRHFRLVVQRLHATAAREIAA